MDEKPTLTHDGLLMLSHQTLGELDKGMAGVGIDEMLKRMAMDIEDRSSESGGGGKSRTLTIKIIATPINETDTQIDFALDLKLPPLTAKTTNGQTRPANNRGRGFAFRAANPERFDQPTIYDKSHAKAEGETDE